MRKGTVYWITGLSGAGKTTIGKLIYQQLSAVRMNVVFLDGDILREVFGDDLGHSSEDRIKSAMRNARLCKMLADQGIDVICATISMFNSCREWNRNNIENYKEIYLRVPMPVLIQRDQKQLYSRALKGEVDHVMGIDIRVEEPDNPDMVIDNDGRSTPMEIAQKILSSINQSGVQA